MKTCEHCGQQTLLQMDIHLRDYCKAYTPPEPKPDGYLIVKGEIYPHVAATEVPDCMSCEHLRNHDGPCYRDCKGLGRSQRSYHQPKRYTY